MVKTPNQAQLKERATQIQKVSAQLETSKLPQDESAVADLHRKWSTINAVQQSSLNKKEAKI